MTIAEGGQSADVGHAVTAEVRDNLFLRHVSELWGVDSAFAGVTAVVERDLDLFFAESGGAEESLGVFSGGCFENQCAIGRSFNLYRVVRTADGGDLLLGPEDVQLSERDGVIDGLDNKKRTERRQIRSIGRAVIVCAVDGCVSQIRAWVGTGSRARGRARVGVPSEVIGRAVVIAPGEVRTRARVGTG